MSLQEWSPEAHLALMKELNISKSILSISSPGTSLTPGDDDTACKLTRQCNDYAAEICSQHPGLGFWASLPLPNVEDTLQEIPYVLDVLKADGITIETNHHGTYLGDPALDKVFDELNRRHAKIFIHPTTPCMKSCHGHGPTPATTLAQYPYPMLEFMFDTVRAVVNLFFSGTIARCPNITFIIPHAGAALPPIIERFTSFSSVIGMGQSLTSQDVKDVFARQFYFDLAGMPFPDQIWGLLRYVGTDRLLYGSDYPFTPAPAAFMLARVMAAEMESIWSEDERTAILVGNARRMLDRHGSNKM
jgi:predicted TIM-barrel fold metal-dependent hydrolase